MEIVATIVVLFLAFVVVRVLVNLMKTAGFKATGALKILDPKCAQPEGRAEPTFEPRHWTPDNDLRDQIRSLTCSLHQKPCMGCALVDFYERNTGVSMAGEKHCFVGRIWIEMCEDCIPEVKNLRKNEFLWKRSNYADHPEWGSWHITRKLIRDYHAELQKWINLTAARPDISQEGTSTTVASTQNKPNNRIESDK